MKILLFFKPFWLRVYSKFSGIMTNTTPKIVTMTATVTMTVTVTTTEKEVARREKEDKKALGERKVVAWEAGSNSIRLVIL